MNRLMLVAAFVLSLAWPLALQAEDKLSISGFGAMSVPAQSGQNYSLRWARVKVDAERVQLKLRFEYDLAINKPRDIFIASNKEWRGGTATLIAGKHLNAIGHLYPSPRALRVPRYPDILNGFTVQEIGISFWYVRPGAVLRLAHYGANQVSAVAAYSGLSLFWEKGAGSGAILNCGSRWLHPYLGIARYHDKRTVAFYQSYAQLWFHTRLYGQVDFGQTDDTLLAGLNHEFAKDCFVKLFYETRKEEVLAELTFAF